MIKRNSITSHIIGVNKSTSKLLRDKQMIENYIEDEIEDNNYLLYFVSYIYALKATITLITIDMRFKDINLNGVIFL